MPIVPNLDAMLTVTQLMEQTLDFLHEIIELEHEHPKEVMVLMMAFITGLTIQLKDKLETLEPGLGEQLLEAVNANTNSNGREVIEKLNKNDPSLNESSSEIASDDLAGAVNFIVKKISGTVGTSLNELPYRLRNDVIVLHSLSAMVGEIFNKFAVRDLDASIEEFASNVRVFATKGERKDAFKKTYN